MAKQTVTIKQVTLRIGGKKKDKAPVSVSGYSYTRNGKTIHVAAHTRKASA